jgi:hypothetical protein
LSARDVAELLAWGGIFLGERLTPRMLAGAAIVLAGTALATGLVKLARERGGTYDASAPPPARGAAS